LCVFPYWGWDACLPISEETKDPHKNPGKAAVLATILVLGTYVLVSYAIQAFAGFGTTGIGLNNPQNANDTLSILGEPVVGSGLAVVLLLAISSSSLASVLTCLAPTARSMLAMAVYRALPQPFAKVHRCYQTPWFGTLVVPPESRWPCRWTSTAPLGRLGRSVQHRPLGSESRGRPRALRLVGSAPSLRSEPTRCPGALRDVSASRRPSVAVECQGAVPGPLPRR
jgi:hypothetical protein